MRYWLHISNLKYEIGKRADRALLHIAHIMPGRLRMWVVVSSANESIFNLHPREDGYAGPDGLTFSHIYDGAVRKRTPNGHTETGVVIPEA